MSMKALACVVTLTGIMLIGSAANASAESDLDKSSLVCESLIDVNAPGDPHEWIRARRLSLSMLTNQAVLGRFGTQAYNVSDASDIFKAEYLIENLMFTTQVDSDTGVTALLSTDGKLMGTLRPAQGSFHLLMLSRDLVAERVVCR
jgi:hypothetical protein